MDPTPLNTANTSAAGIPAGDTAPVVLVAMPPWSVESPPVGVACISTYLRTQGIQTRIVDLNLELYQSLPREQRYLWSLNFEACWLEEGKFANTLPLLSEALDRWVDNILAAEPAVVGISVCSPKQRISLELLQRLKARAPQVHIVLGGVACGTREERSLFVKEARQALTGFVVGEGEETFHEVASQLLSPEPALDDIAGFLHLAGRQDNEFAAPLRRPLLDLDQVPQPTLEEFDLSRYSDTVALEMSRGCTGSCTFCLVRTFHHGLRRRSADSVFAQLEQHARSGVKHFMFVDSLINSSVELLAGLCDRILKSGLRIHWSGQALPRKEMTPALLKKMRAAGCDCLEYGFESASDEVLKLMRKRFTSEEGEQVVRDTHQAGIETALYLIVGYPGEGETEFLETCDFLRRNAGYIDRIKSINMVYLMYHTYLHDHHEELGIELPPGGDGFFWRAGSNTLERRRERIERIQLLIKELRLEYELDSNLEIDQMEQPILRRAMVPGHRETGDLAIQMRSIHFRDGAGEPARQFTPGSPMTIVIGYEVITPTENPMIRLMIFSFDNVACGERVVFAAYTQVVRDYLGSGSPGPRQVRLVIPSLNLMPGTYQCTIGIWPDEGDKPPFDAVHASNRFQVTAEQGPANTLAHIPCAWQVIRRSEVSTGEDGLHGVPQLTSPRGMDELVPGGDLRARLECTLSHPERLRLVAGVLNDGIVIWRDSFPGTLPAGRSTIELHLDPLNVGAGEFDLALYLQRRGSGDKVDQVLSTFVVHRVPGPAEGLVHCPAFWEIPRDYRPDVQILEVSLARAGIRPDDACEMGGELLVDLRYRFHSPVSRYLLRVDLVEEEPGGHIGLSIIESDTERAGLLLSADCPGERQARLRFPAHLLAAGRYAVVCGVWPGPGTSLPLDIHRGRLRFSVVDPRGLEQAGVRLVDVPTRWTYEEEMPQHNPPDNHLGDAILIVDGDDHQATCFTPSDSLKARVATELNTPRAVRLVALLMVRDRVLHRSECTEPLPPGSHVMGVAFSPLSLLRGKYTFAFALESLETGEIVAYIGESIMVISSPEDGGGLVRAQPLWDLPQTDLEPSG